jgi:hypothetical protein
LLLQHKDLSHRTALEIWESIAGWILLFDPSGEREIGLDTLSPTPFRRHSVAKKETPLSLSIPLDVMPELSVNADLLAAIDDRSIKEANLNEKINYQSPMLQRLSLRSCQGFVKLLTA